MGDIRLKTGEYFIDGNKFGAADAARYLRSMGFSMQETLEFLKNIPTEA
jgi:hypothetical protein